MRSLPVICALAMFALPATAHETGIPHKHPHDATTTGATAAKTGPNGGQVAIADHHPIEMVASDAEEA